jgi:hypothetical protein
MVSGDAAGLTPRAFHVGGCSPKNKGGGTTSAEVIARPFETSLNWKNRLIVLNKTLTDWVQKGERNLW